jgi:AcrR family transcriptional regulator
VAGPASAQAVAEHPAAEPSAIAPRPSRRRRLTAEDRRGQITGAAREVFARSGLAGARVREIAEQAAVNPALLYQHFDSKEALFEASVAEPLEAALSELTRRGLELRPRAGSASARRESLASLLEELIAVLLELGPLLGVLLFADPERGRAFYAARLAPALEALSAAVAGAMDWWEHREFDPRLAVSTAFASCLMLALDHHFGGTLLADTPGAARELAVNLLDGIEAPGGA